RDYSWGFSSLDSDVSRKRMHSSARTDSSQFLEFVPLRIIFLAEPELHESRFIALNDSSAWLSTPNTISLTYHLPSIHHTEDWRQRLSVTRDPNSSVPNAR